MKKHIFLIILSCVIVILAAASLFVSRFLMGNPGNPFPFDYLTVDDVESVMVNAVPPDTSKLMSEDRITEMVQLLNNVEIFRRDRDMSDNLVGQLVQYDVTKKDGTKQSIGIVYPWIIINGVWYRSHDSYFELNELNLLANSFLGTPFGLQED